MLDDVRPVVEFVVAKLALVLTTELEELDEAAGDEEVEATLTELVEVTGAELEVAIELWDEVVEVDFEPLRAT